MSDNIVADLVRAGRANRADTLKGLLDAAAAWKPSGYDAGVALRRDYLGGRQGEHLKETLGDRYPETAHEISAYVVPLFAHLCRYKATIYRVPPKREVVGGDGDAMIRVYAGAMIDHALQRLEKISAACGLGFLRVGWDARLERVDVRHFWPDRVHVILNPDRPADLAAAYGVLAELVSGAGLRPKSDDRRFELWTSVDGGWTRTIIGSSFADPGELEEQTLYPVLPFVALPYARPDSSLFEALSDDDLVVNDAVNVACSDLLHTVSRQSFNQLTYSGPPIKKERLCVGVGDILTSDEGGMWGNIAYSPQIQPVTELLRERVGQHLVLNSVSPNSASADPKYESGVAAKIQNLPMMESRAERVPSVREFEERELWPVVVEVAKAGGIYLSGEMRWQPGPLALPVDDEAEFRLAQGRVAADLSTWPQEMVRAGLFPDVAAAAEAYAENKAYNDRMAPTRGYGVPFVKSDTMAALQGTEAQVEAGGGTVNGDADTERIR